MAAGLGFKDFTTGEVLTAADVDGYLMQGIWVFASAAARDAAVTSPQEGNACYLKDTNQVLTYSGSAWVAVGGGSPLTTKGDVYGFSTVDARIPIGANNTVLTADSTQALGLKWAAPAGGGKVLQVVTDTATTDFSTTSTTYQDTGLSVTITPSLASSKVLVQACMPDVYGSYSGSQTVLIYTYQLVRDSTVLQKSETGVYQGASATNRYIYGSINFTILDAPATTSAVTYKVQGRCEPSQASLCAFAASATNIATITVSEIGA